MVLEIDKEATKIMAAHMRPLHNEVLIHDKEGESLPADDSAAR